MKSKPAQPALAQVPWSKRRWDVTAVVILLAATLPWWSALRAPFILMDDLTYLQNNPDMRVGLTFETFLNSFATTRGTAWMPLTWISLLLDRILFGPGPVGFHATNVVFHIANTLLLYFFLRIATQKPARSLLAAALFAMHPLRVESVAWVTERKDVLFMFFGLLSLIAYLKFVQSPRQKPRRWYALSLIFFACSLMSKAMLLTLPCVLLLIDYWPLNRLSLSTWKSRVVEKIPFLLLSIGIVAADMIAIAKDNNVSTHLPPIWRLQNALISCTLYLRDHFYFEDLSIYYPGGLPIAPADVFAAATLLILITAAILFFWRKFPAAGSSALIGWLWFLGTLVPVLGIFPLGTQSRADRFTYFPSIGLALALFWPWPAAWFAERGRKFIAAIAGAGCVLALAVYMSLRLLLWHNPLALYLDGIAHTNNVNPFLDNIAGATLLDAGNPEEALAHFQRALQYAPQLQALHHSSGVALKALGRNAEALGEFQIAHEAYPDNKVFEASYRQALLDAQSPPATQPH